METHRILTNPATKTYLISPRAKVQKDTTPGSVGTFTRIVVKNGPTLTPIRVIQQRLKALWASHAIKIRIVRDVLDSWSGQSL